MSKPQRRFQFIDNSNVSSSGTNSTQVRRHVMQEYMREKRWEARSQSDIAAESPRPIRKKPDKAPSAISQPRPTAKRAKRKTTPAFESRDTRHSTTSQGASNDQSERQSQHDDPVEQIVRYDPDLEAVSRRPSAALSLGPSAFAKLADMIPNPPFTPPSSINSSDRTSPHNWQWRANGPTSQSPEPQSYLSAARTDPFDCLPMVLSAQDQELFDFYANVMPACSYGFERRSPLAHNWYLTVFIPEAMKGAVCFQNTILVHAANTQAWVQGLPETRLAIEHRAKASQLLLHHYQRLPHDTSDATISATISAAALEDFDPRLERRVYAWMHWEAVMQKIRDRGGPAALVQNNRLQMLINWSDYIFSGYKGHGATFYFDHQSSPRHTNEQEAEAIGRTEIAQQTEELITFLKCAEHLALVQAGMQNNPVSRSQQPLRYSVFLPGRPLYNLLASPNGARYTDTGQFKQIISRLGALMTINTAIWEYRHSTELSEGFFAELVDNIMNNELDQHISVEALIQILLSGSKNPALLHTERPWFVGRMLKVSKRLSRPTFERLNDLLLSFLTLGPGLSPVMLGWESELRTEILQAPLWPRIAEKLPHHHLNAVQDVWGRQRQLISDGGIILSVLGPEFANSKGQSSVGAGFEQSVGFSGVDSKRSPKTISGQSMLSLEDHINLLLTFWRVKWPGWKGVFAFRGEICCLGRGMAGMWTLRTTSQKSTCIHPDIVSRELVARQDRYADRGESHVRQFASGERKYQASLTSCSPGGRLVFCELLSCGSDWAAPLGRIRGRLWALFPTREQAEDPCSLDRCRSIDHQGNNLLAQQVCSAIIQTCNCFGHHNRKRRNFSVTCAQLFADYVVFLQSPDASQMLLVSFCCAFACLGALLFGYDSGIISSSIAQTDFVHHFGSGTLADNTAGGIVSSFTGGAIVSSLCLNILSDRYGRRAAIFIGAILGCVGGALQGGANSIATVIVGRVIAGLAVGLLSATIPNYCSEVAHPKFRALLAGLQQWNIGLGFVCAQWIGYGSSLVEGPFSWRFPLSIQVLPALVLATGVWFLPESPRFLAERGDLTSARAVLSRLHNDPALVEAEYQRIQDNLEAERDSRMGWRDLFQVPGLRRRLLLACGIQLFTITSGINVINYYGPRIYAYLHFGTTRSLMIIGIYGALAQVYNTICIAFVDRIGRRKLLIPSMIGMGAALCVNATLAHYYIDGEADPGRNGNALRASVATYFIFSVFFTSLGCISWIFSSEVFPTAARAKGTSLSTFTNWAVNLIFAQCSPVALTNLGYRYFYLFTAFNWTAAIVVYFFYPETQGHTLESVNELFGDLQVRQEIDTPRRVDTTVDVEKVMVPGLAVSTKPASS